MEFPKETLADGLGHPEGPDVLPNGDVVMVETYTSKIVACSPSRGLYDYADCGGGPNACMLGSDALYITQNGGTVGRWRAEVMSVPSIQKAESFAEAGRAWWLLCRPSPKVIKARSLRFVASFAKLL